MFLFIRKVIYIFWCIDLSRPPREVNSILNHNKVYIIVLFDCFMERELKSVVDLLHRIFEEVDGPDIDGHQEAYLIGMEIIDREKRKEFSNYQ